jgi:hypothetical protein
LLTGWSLGFSRLKPGLRAAAYQKTSFPDYLVSSGFRY